MALLQWMLENISDDNSIKMSLEEQHETFQINVKWLKFLNLSDSDIVQLQNVYKLVQRDRERLIIYPDPQNVHSWSYLCSPEEIKVIIVGQDPYPDGRGHGLAFSTVRGCSPPNSLKTIFAELERTIENFKAPAHGSLKSWCAQGVLLLNTVFTVIRGVPMSHEAIGWQVLSNRIINQLSEKMQNLVFMLWGSQARKLVSLIDSKKHLILECAHPSPRTKGSKTPFIGCGHFLKANKYLQIHNKCPIDWNITNDL
ncbi:uracil-DNA glycosylase [Human betaherpesvirus 7]|uniref:Uracil-DNA glycosylase n=3 Tax=Human betaherpesvirus 7 TaxID=10372 RepID=UNG_HHV7J|nr:uracil-DNA glycosylase [Human betaherpesvirus 7]P50639.1 RecName: Full=Uracil-DNA glycosylase; Short=UDG; AltName: Full=UNG [Human herpesvirus 7 strain JI]AAC40793.1 U81 [Human betaherpesvirus 7]AAC54743.1 uracil-DNA glycosylase [Human betaherpesvirus 7]AGV28703.1 U81 [Human betaherpesvirus 7]UQK62817.1 U81 [Human betaherpesvirus 7]UQK62887.1 U81 [Human betaherpesvirus 7]